MSSGLIHESSSSPDLSGGAASGEQRRGGGGGGDATATPSRYEAQKRRDWNTFGQYLKNHRPPLALARCSGAHVLEFLRYLDQFGKTKIHAPACPFFGNAHPPAPCACPLRQAWGSLDALIGRLRAAFEEHGGKPESNPFGTRAVRLYLREVRELQAKARGIAYEKKKRKRPNANNSAAAGSNRQNHTQNVQQIASQNVQQMQQQQPSSSLSGNNSQNSHHHHHLMVNIPHNLQQQQHPTIVHHLHPSSQNSAGNPQQILGNNPMQVPLIQHQQLQHHQQQVQQQQFLSQGLQILN